MARVAAVTRLLRELRAEGITDPRVLAAISKIPRELFVPADCHQHAYSNIPLPIGHGQTISQPYVVALMTQALHLTGVEKVLEVGTGSGYQCAVLAETAGQVVSLERITDLASAARDRLERLGYRNVQVRAGDGSVGCPDDAPFDAIVVTAASPRTSVALIEQLTDDGRLVLPVGSLFSQELLLYTMIHGEAKCTRLGPVRFVPLVGDTAWSAAEARAFLDERY